MASKKFIQKAIKHPGSLTRAAKQQGKTISEYCQGGQLATRRQRQCNLAKTLKKLSKKR